MEKEYKSEEEFLKHYDSSRFEKLSATTDIAIFSVSSSKQENYRKLNKAAGDISLAYINSAYSEE